MRLFSGFLAFKGRPSLSRRFKNRSDHDSLCIESFETRTMLSAAPIISRFAETSTREKYTARFPVDGDVRVADVGAQGFAGYRLIVSLADFQPGDDLRLRSTTYTVNGSGYFFNRIGFGQVDTTANGIGEVGVKLNEHATSGLIQGFLRSLNFETTSSSRETRTVTISLFDSAGVETRVDKDLNFLPELSTIRQRVTAVANWIKDLQYTDPGKDSYGAFRVGYGPGSYDLPAANNQQLFLVRQYFANFALIALLQHNVEGSVDASAKWISWYLNHLEIGGERDGMVRLAWYNGAGDLPSRAWMDANERLYGTDADDSDAALFLILVREFQKAGGSLTSLRSAIPNFDVRLERVANVLLRLQKDDGLTWGKPNLTVKYTGDNA